MLIDEKGRLFGKVNIVDFIVVAVIILGILGVAYKYVKSSSSLFKKTEDMQIVFFNEDLPQYVADSIKVGDKVKDSVKNTVFGEVEAIEIDKSIVFAANDKGELMQTSRPGYVSMKLIVKGKGIYTDTGVIFNNSDYYIGRTLELRAGNGVIWTRVSDIKKAE